MNELPREMQELLAGYVLGDLEPDEVEIVNTILQTQPELQAEIDRLQFTLSLLPLALPETLPSSDLRLAILSEESPAQPTSPRTSNNQWLWILSGLVAVLTTGWLIDGHHLRQKLASLEQNHQQIASTESKMLMLKPMDRQDNAWGVVSVVPTRRMAVVQIRNLEPLTQDKVYRLWVVSMNGKKIDCGELRPNERGEVNIELPVSETQLRGAQITLEPIERSPQPRGALVMQSET